MPICREFMSKPSDGLEPSTPSLPWKFWCAKRVHARSPATHFRLQIQVVAIVEMRRERSGVSFLTCPFCVRALMPREATARVALCSAVGYATPSGHAARAYSRVSSPSHARTLSFR